VKIIKYSVENRERIGGSSGEFRAFFGNIQEYLATNFRSPELVSVFCIRGGP